MITVLPPQLVATVVNEWPLRQRNDDAFEYLAWFIFGDNKSVTSIAMTSPVVRSQLSDSTYETAFIMPSKRTLDTVPEPNNDRVSLTTTPSSLQAVWKFSWYVTQDAVDREWEFFQKELRSNEIVRYGMPTLAQYDWPWVAASSRRNELRVSLNPL
jgi:hypothetical protein